MIKGFIKFVIVAGLVVGAVFALKAIFGVDAPIVVQ